MPPKSTWFTHIPEIIERLDALNTPVVDRAVCERLFGVRSRRANDLMQIFGGYRSGNTVLLDRVSLIRSLQHLASTSEFAWECNRKYKLSDRLNELHRYRRATAVKLPVSTGVRGYDSKDLPANVVLEPGRLVVRFGATEELFARLFELAQAAVDNFDAIRALAEIRAPSTQEHG